MDGRPTESGETAGDIATMVRWFEIQGYTVSCEPMRGGGWTATARAGRQGDLLEARGATQADALSALQRAYRPAGNPGPPGGEVIRDAWSGG